MNPNNTNTPPPNQPPLGQDQQQPGQFPQPVNPYAYQSQPLVQASYVAPKKIKKLILIPFVVLVVIVIGLGGWLALRKSAPVGKEVAVTLPQNWQTLDTKLGFTVKAPTKWKAGAFSTSDTGGVKSKSVNLSPVFGASDSAVFTSIIATTYQDTDNLDKTGFEQKVTDKATYKELYSLLGDDASKIKLAATHLNIGGKDWLRVDFGIATSTFTSLYYWANDHAIGLGVSGDGTSEGKNSAYQDYLLPMAASVELTE